jgi:poly(3-hydroxyalkanoate) synthetase
MHALCGCSGGVFEALTFSKGSDTIMSEIQFYTAADVARILDVSLPTAYRIIARLNAELAEKGFFIVRGRVPKRYFSEKFYC